MNYTIYDIPVIRTLVRWATIIFLKIVGWKVEGRAPDLSRYVMTAAPHTSNWDFVYALLVSCNLGIRINLMTKKEIFRWPFGPFLKFVGAVPVDRSKSNGLVGQVIQAFENNERLVVAIAPAGTRKKVAYWRTGFYHMAKGANVPIVLGFLDYGRKTGGIGPTIYLTGNMNEDMKNIREFYDSINAKYPEKALQMSASVMAQ